MRESEAGREMNHVGSFLVPETPSPPLWYNRGRRLERILDLGRKVSFL